MSKIIIHNKTDKPDDEILKYVKQAIEHGVYNGVSESYYLQFADKTQIQYYKQKTCNTFYVY